MFGAALARPQNNYGQNLNQNYRGQQQRQPQQAYQQNYVAQPAQPVIEIIRQENVPHNGDGKTKYKKPAN